MFLKLFASGRAALVWSAVGAAVFVHALIVARWPATFEFSIAIALIAVGVFVAAASACHSPRLRTLAVAAIALIPLAYVVLFFYRLSQST